MPAGTGPAGLYAESDAATGRPDPTTLSTYFDGVTGGPVYDATTRQLKQMTGVRQRVALTLATCAGSSTTLPNWGVRKLDRHSASFVEEREQTVRDALRSMTDVEKSIRIESITVEVEGSRDRTTVVYTDLTTNKESKVTA